MATDDIEEVSIAGRNRSPSMLERMRKAPGHMATGTILPRLVGMLSPGLYRERGDTTSLVEKVFGDGGELESMALENPALLTEIRHQADQPMSADEHGKFRSAILGMVGDQIKKEDLIQRTLAENAGFMRSFAMLDAAIPGIKDPERYTYEEAERSRVVELFNEAQRLAPLDPDGSKSLMADARKKADELTGSVRTEMEKIRKAARIEDTELSNISREQISEHDDIIKSLMHDRDEKGFLKDPNGAIMGRALAALGRAGNLPGSGFADTLNAAAPVGAAVGGRAGNIIDAGIDLAKNVAGKVTESKDIDALIDRLQFNKQLLQQSYVENRENLKQRYGSMGMAFGEQAGEVYAVLSDDYKKHADTIPTKPAQTDAERASDKQTTLRTVLSDEVGGATAEVERLKPEAAANMPGASQRLAAAIERQAIARDDLNIFEAETAGVSEEQMAPEAARALNEARQRRTARTQTRQRSQVRQTIMETLRSRTR